MTSVSSVLLIERVNVIRLLRDGSVDIVERVATTSTTTAGALTPSARRVQHAGGDVRQAAAKVGADVVVNERVGTRVAVGQTVDVAVVTCRQPFDFLCFSS